MTLVYALPVDRQNSHGGRLMVVDRRRAAARIHGRRRFHLGPTGDLRHPFSAVAGAGEGVAWIDMHPAVYRTGYNSGTGELFLAFYRSAPEKPSAAAILPVRVRACLKPVSGPLLRVVPRSSPLPHAEAGALDAVRQDQ